MSQPIRKGSVLVIDDEVDVLNALQRQLKRYYEVFIVNSAIDGYTVLRDHTIDVVISDQRMPDVPGNEFLANVHENWPRAKLILLTGYSDMSAVVDSVNRAHIFSYVEKPWNIEAFRAIVQKAYQASLVPGPKAVDLITKSVTEDIISEIGKLCKPRAE